jgi:hypothetical protein
LWTRTTKSGDLAKTAFQRDWNEFHTFKSVNSPWKKFGQKYRLPVETLSGPRIEDEYAKYKVMQNVLIESKVILDANLDHELEYELSKLK